MKTWKSSGYHCGCSISSSLQWGHGDEAVEENSPLTALVLALMLLQWGHGDEAVEEVREIDSPVGLPLASMGPRR